MSSPSTNVGATSTSASQRSNYPSTRPPRSRVYTSTPPLAWAANSQLMMENIPIDTSHPAVREYLALIRCVRSSCNDHHRGAHNDGLRLQVLTPLSLLINIATVTICTFLLSPNLGTHQPRSPSSFASHVLQEESPKCIPPQSHPSHI